MYEPLPEILQRNFDQLLADRGSWMVYTRSDPRFPCQACWDLNTRTGRANCEQCFGTGRKVTLERWLTLPANVLRATQVRDASLSSLGWTTENEPIIFTRRVDIPMNPDRLLMVEWDRSRKLIPTQGRPIRIHEAYLVNWVEPQLAGEVIYYAAHCDRVTENLEAYQQALYHTPLRTTRR
jgi:hypothetical protein